MKANGFVLLLVLVVIAVMLCGCTTYHAKVADAEITMTYFLQDKDFKVFRYDPNDHTVTIENFGSETSQVVESAVAAALGGAR